MIVTGGMIKGMKEDFHPFMEGEGTENNREKKNSGLGAWEGHRGRKKKIKGGKQVGMLRIIRKAKPHR